MQVEAYLNLVGRCEEPLAFYRQVLGAQVSAVLRWKESPDRAMKAPPGSEDKIMHAVFGIDEATLVAGDGAGAAGRAFFGS